MIYFIIKFRMQQPQIEFNSKLLIITVVQEKYTYENES